METLFLEAQVHLSGMQWVKDKLNKAFLPFLRFIFLCIILNIGNLEKPPCSACYKNCLFFANFRVPENPIMNFGFTILLFL